MKIKLVNATGFYYEHDQGQRLSIQFGPLTCAKSSHSFRLLEVEKVEIALLDAEDNFIYQPWGYVPAEVIPTVMLLFRYNDFASIDKMLTSHSIGQGEQKAIGVPPPSNYAIFGSDAFESWDHSDDADALASAGWGTDEDYGDRGCGDD